MGYMGLGIQKWIYTMKPRKFFGKRNKPNGDRKENIAGHEMKDYYHLEPNELSNVRQRKYNDRYRKKVNDQLVKDSHKRKIFSVISLIIALLIVALLFSYVNSKLEWF